MRLLQLRVEHDTLDAVLDALRGENVDPVVLPTYDGENSDESRYLVVFPLPTEAVDRIREALEETGFEEEHLVIGTAESAKTPHYEELIDRYVEGDEEEERISNDEIRTKARNLHPQPTAYYGMTVLSALVATAGLLLDSPALVVGSMVIAPQVGAALTGSVGLALGESKMFRSGLRSTIVGLTVAIVTAALLGWGLKTAQFVPTALSVTTIEQIASRTSPGLLTLLVALCAGAAGGIGLATELPVSIVGVAVAAATVPAAAAIGIGIAWLLPPVAMGAFTLLAVNVAGIVFAGTLSLWYLGYRPGFWEATDSTRERLEAVLADRATWVAVAFLLVAAVGPGVLLTTHIAFENQTTGAVQSVLDGPEYDALELASIRVDFDTLGVGDSTREVTVTVRRPADQPYPALGPQLSQAISVATGAEVRVVVEFEDEQRVSPQ
ncbi:TIGR00341 family protein [Haloferax namakaokahaiae]|uniref:TIGR00341 family protein n=1 Tax=Haloferax namakaokahaiae TaxID=1748331 RepID=A0ABD5ZF01_9EURY